MILEASVFLDGSCSFATCDVDGNGRIGPTDAAATDVAFVLTKLADLLGQVEGEVLSGERSGDL